MKNRSTETPAFSPFSSEFRFSFVQFGKYSIYIRWFFSMLNVVNVLQIKTVLICIQIEEWQEKNPLN